MATKKLSEALAELQKAASVSGLDVRLVVAGQSSTSNAQTITLQQLLTALGIPSVQTDAAGTAGKYIYSNKNDSTKAALSGVFKVYQYGNELYLRHKYWGSSNNYDDGLYTTVKIPPATTSADGVLEWEYLVRLRNATMTETGTTTGVNLSYPNFANGGTKTLTLTAATTAKAGVMSVAHVNALNSLSSHIVDLGHFTSEEEALRKLGTLGICNDKSLVHAHLTYAVGSGTNKNTLILIQSIHDNYCRQFIFNKDKVYQRGLTFADDSLTTITLQEDWALLFGDRLAWSEGNHGYVLSQFGQGYGHSMCDPIPYASTTNDGLMTKEDKQLLEKIKTQLNL